MHLLGVFLVAGCAWAVSSALSLPRISNAVVGGSLASLRARRDVGDAECGVRGPSYETLIAGGEDASVGEFPWHVGVYRQVVNKPHVQDCGGTLITRSLVITAAHCFWEESTRRKKPKALYEIAAGKFLRDWDQEEHGVQASDVAEIHIPKRYRGRGSQFQYDIAVVKLATRFDFTVTVKPICMDWSKQYESQQLVPGSRGIAAGWGKRSNGLAADALQKVELPFVDFDTCYNALPENAKNLYTDDKFCAGFANKGRSVCQGDSGGGIAFSGANDRYFLRGVVSVSFKPEANRDPCFSQLYTGFTLVSRYMPWITTFVDPKEREALTPRKPQREKSVSEKMCEVYSAAVYESKSLNPSRTSTVQVSTCAMSPTGVTTQRLLSQPKEFPHVAAIGYLQNSAVKWRCIGSLISERYVLAPAHCIQPRLGELKYVRLGSINLYTNNTDQGLIHVEVDEVIRHPEHRVSSVYNDIALLRLKENVRFNGYVRPACLDPYPDTLDNSVLTAASWGRTESTSDVYDGLQNGDARVEDTSNCIRAYANFTTKLKNGINPETQLCFSTFDYSTDCALLSGSPIMAKLSTPYCMYRIVGFSTFGARACGTDNAIPNVATRVSGFARWLESIVWPGQRSVQGRG